MKHRFSERRQLVPLLPIPIALALKEHAVRDDVDVGGQGVVELLPAHLLDHVRDARGEDKEGNLGALFGVWCGVWMMWLLRV